MYNVCGWFYMYLVCVNGELQKMTLFKLTTAHLPIGRRAQTIVRVYTRSEAELAKK